MDCTVANIKREYATDRTLWVLVVGLGASVLAGLEVARWLHAAQASGRLILGAALVVGCAGYLISGFLAKAARRASWQSDLWRKFGLDPALLDAVAHRAPDATEVLDAALRDLRTLAALANAADWAEHATDSPEDAVSAGERALTAALLAGDAERLAAVGAVLAEAAGLLLEALAALRRDEPQEHDASWRSFRGCSDRLSELALSAAPPVAPRPDA